MKKNVLTEFQEHLRSSRHVQAKYIPFYIHWASKFLAFSIGSVKSPFFRETCKI
jgi:hypothetical protein